MRGHIFALHAWFSQFLPPDIWLLARSLLMALEKTHLVSHARLSFGGAFGSGLPCGCFQASALLPSFHTLTTCLDDGGRSPQWLAWNAASKFQFIITGIYAASCLPGLYCSIIWLPSKWWAPTSSKVDKMEVYIMSKKPSKHGNRSALWERKFSYNMSPSLRGALWLKHWSHRALKDIKWKISQRYIGANRKYQVSHPLWVRGVGKKPAGWPRQTYLGPLDSPDVGECLFWHLSSMGPTTFM